MDIKILYKDIAVGNGGIPLTVEGEEELEQKINIALSAVKGSFIYDRSLGALSSGFTLDEEGRTSLESLINEALVNCSCSVKVKRYVDLENSVKVVLDVFDGFRTFETEVYIDG